MEERLLQIGEWLAIYGESIYAYGASNFGSFSRTRTMPLASETFDVSPSIEDMTFASDQNNVFGQVSPRSSKGSIVYLGSYSSGSGCEVACAGNSSCLSFVYFSNSADPAYVGECFGRTDPVWLPLPQTGVTSGTKSFATAYYTRPKGNDNVVYAIIDTQTLGSVTLRALKGSSDTTVSVLGSECAVKLLTGDGVSFDVSHCKLRPTPTGRIMAYAVKMTNVSFQYSN